MATEFISNSWLMPTNANAEANRVSNYSLDFDSASSQYVNVGSISSLQNATEYSISSWFKTPLNNLYQVIYSWFDGADGYLQLLLVNDGSFVVYNYRTSNAYGISATGVVSADVWYNATVVFDGSGAANADRLKLYINDTLITLTYTGTIPTQTGTMLSSTMWLGASNSSNFWGLEGKLTEVSIFDYALSASQVTELYGTGSAIGNPMAITNGRKPIYYAPLGNSAFNGEFLVPNGAEQDFVFDYVSSSSQFITLASSSTAITDWTQPYTISMWVNYTTSLSFDLMATFGVETGSAATSRYIMIGGSSGYLFTGVGDTDGGSTNIHFNIGSNLNDGNWHHLVYVGDGTSGDFPTVYIDGVVEAYSGGTTNLFNSSTYLNVIGTGSTASGRYFNGKMSNCAIFSGALPATGTESVASLYNYGTPPNIASYSGLQAWWELDASATFDGSNWSIPDASSNSNTGTSSGMTAANLVQSDLIINAPYDPFSLLFDGIDESISIGNVWSGLIGSYTWSPFTISFWYKGTNPIVGATHTKGLFSFKGTQQIGFYDGYAGAANVRLYLNFSGSYSNYWIVGSNGTRDLFDDNWHNVVIVFPSGSNDGVDPASSTLYIDNQLITKSSSGGITAPAVGYTWNQFNIMDADWANLGGQLSNLVLWGNDQTSEISNIYNNGTPASSYTNTPDGWWRLGAVNTFYNSTTTEFTVLDEVGTNNGTSVNMEQSDLVSGVGATGSGTSSGMGSGENRIGSAPFSENNAVSYNLSVTAKSTSTPT